MQKKIATEAVISHLKKGYTLATKVITSIVVGVTIEQIARQAKTELDNGVTLEVVASVRFAPLRTTNGVSAPATRSLPRTPAGLTMWKLL
jgi:hypothetical protein